MTTTYQALLTTAGSLPALDAKETDEDFLKRLVLAISSTPVPTFDRMDSGARLWFEEAADALAAGVRIPLPEGFDRDAMFAPPPVRTIARPRAAVQFAPEPPPIAAPQPPQTEPVAGEPLRVSIIKLVISHPDLSLEGLIRKLGEYSIRAAPATVSDQRGFALSMLRAIREAGWRPPDAIA